MTFADIISPTLVILCLPFYMSPGHRISFEEFIPIMTATIKKKEQGTMDEFVEGLRVFDKDGNSSINSAELRHVLTSLGKRLVGS